MLKIHHLVLSRSNRIIWLAEELGLKYDLVRHARDPQTFLATETLRSVSPVGKAPIIEDSGKIIEESGAIVEYVLDTYGQGRLRPATGTAAFDQYRYWLHAAETTLMLPVMLDMMSRMAKVESPTFDYFMRREYGTMLGHVEATLKKQAYIAGAEFSAADIMVGFTLSLAAGTAIPGSSTRAPMAELGATQAYLQKLEQRPAYQRTLEIIAG